MGIMIYESFRIRDKASRQCQVLPVKLAQIWLFILTTSLVSHKLQVFQAPAWVNWFVHFTS